MIKEIIVVGSKFLLCGFVLLSLIIFSCDDSTGPDPDDNLPTNGKYIQIISPKAGDVFHIGETVKVEFKIDGKNISSVDQKISITGGATWRGVLNQSIPFNETNGILSSFDWVIGQEAETVGYSDTNSNCVLKLEQYNATDTLEIDKTGKFTIIK